MSRLLRRIIFLSFFLLILIFLIRQTNVFPSLQNIFKPKPIAVDQTPLLLTEIRNIAQLMTVEAYNEVVVDSTRYPLGIPPRVFNAIPGNPLGLLAASQLVLIVRGKVVAGVDLKNLNENNIQVQGDSLFVQLPHAQVLEVITNPTGVETFIEEGKWTDEAAKALQIKARNEMVRQAVAQGALQQADAKARQLVYELLKNTGYKSITVTTVLRVNNTSGKQ